MSSTDGSARAPLLGAWGSALAYLLWGLSPAFWKLLDTVPRGALLAHRVLWSLAFMLCVVLARRRGREVWQILAAPAHLVRVVLRALLLSVNWLVFLWGVQNGRIVECSLGYYINPLVSVLLAVLFLGERMTRRQVVSVGLAVAAVAILVVGFGRVPWVALVLAASFGFYGLLRKQAAIPAMPGFAAECLVLAPLAAAYLLLLRPAPEAAPVFKGLTALLLVASGALTSIPLILFAYGVRRIRLATTGFLQYIAPTCHFLLGVFAYGETFTGVHLAAFVLIWCAVALYCWDAVATARKPAP